MSKVPATYIKAQRHLSRRDPVLKRLISTIGPCTLWHNPDRFALLVRSIISQQISSRAAHAISTRLEEILSPRALTPANLLKLSDEDLRDAGISAGKARALRDLAAKVHRKEVPLHKLHELDDDEVIATLDPVWGIGPWTAQMFLIFSLGRLDVLAVDDLGLRSGIQRQYELNQLPTKAEVTELAEPWRPYRSIATWYIWRSFGAVPQSE